MIWLRAKGLTETPPSSMTISSLQQRLVGRYFYSKHTATELTRAIFMRLREEKENGELKVPA